MEIRKKVTGFLIRHRFPTRLTGYQYLKESIIVVINSETAPSNKELFSNIAENFDTSFKNVERCLLTLADKMWLPLKEEGFFVERPTIRELIFECTERIMTQEEVPSVYDIFS